MSNGLIGLIPDAYTILSKSFTKIGDLGEKILEEENSARQQRTINQLITCSNLYQVIMRHMIINDAGTAIIGTKNQDAAVLNDLLLQLKKAAGFVKVDVFPTPLTTYNFNFADGGSQFDVSGAMLGDMIWFDGTQFTLLSGGTPGWALVYTPSGPQWQSVVGNGIPSGGTTGQFLRKVSNTNYATYWGDVAISDLAGVTVSANEINVLDGVDFANVSSTDINQLIGLNGNIQDQLNEKLNGLLANGRFYVGNLSGVATAVLPTGDVVFDNAGVFSITANSIVNDDIAAAAGIERTKFESGDPYRLVVNDITGVMSQADAITADRVLISDANGIPIASNVTTASFDFFDPTSSIQNQLDSRLVVNLSSPIQGDMLVFNGTDWVNFAIGTAGQVITSDGNMPVWGPATSNGLPAGGDASQFLQKIDSDPYNADWHTLVFADISDTNSVTATEINLLSGLLVGADMLNYSFGLDGNIQDQLNNKLSAALANHAIFIGGLANTAIQVGPGPDDSILTIVAGHPTWQTPPAPGNVSGPISSTDNAIVRWNLTSGDVIQNSNVIVDDLGNMMFPNGSAVQTSQSAGNTLLFKAYDVDGEAYVTFATLTANNTPTFDLAASVTIGGNYIYRAGGTDVSLADGGTGASLADPGFDAIFMWDNSTNATRLAQLDGLIYDSGSNTLSSIYKVLLWNFAANGGNFPTEANVLYVAEDDGGVPANTWFVAKNASPSTAADFWFK
jgi:hypothetical protein